MCARTAERAGCRVQDAQAQQQAGGRPLGLCLQAVGLPQDPSQDCNPYLLQRLLHALCTICPWPRTVLWPLTARAQCRAAQPPGFQTLAGCCCCPAVPALGSQHTNAGCPTTVAPHKTLSPNPSTPPLGAPTFSSASCMRWKCASVWKLVAMSLAASVLSRLAKKSSTRQPSRRTMVRCTCAAGPQPQRWLHIRKGSHSPARQTQVHRWQVPQPACCSQQQWAGACLHSACCWPSRPRLSACQAGHGSGSSMT